jgi:pimeloyl-ACP methyl ester carboxylesterase
MKPGRRRAARNVLIGTAAAVAAVAAGTAASKYMVRRARSQPDPERGEPLSERPGIERRVRSFDGTTLSVNVVGPQGGPTLVFIHGFSLDMTGWHYQWKELSKRFRCVLYDQRGHGRSDPAAGGDYSLQALGRDLRAVLDDVAPDGPVGLLGHSLGGMTIMALADEFPEEFGRRVGAVVLANTAAGELIKAVLGGVGTRLFTALLPSTRKLLADPERLHRIRERAIGKRADLAFLVAKMTNFGPKAPPSLIEYAVGVAARAPAEVWTDLMASLVELDLTDALESITAPTLVIVGDVDRLTPPSTALAMKRRLPRARLVVMEGTGHCAMLERHQQFNRVVERFLDETLVVGGSAVDRAGRVRATAGGGPPRGNS